MKLVSLATILIALVACGTTRTDPKCANPLFLSTFVPKIVRGHEPISREEVLSAWLSSPAQPPERERIVLERIPAKGECTCCLVVLFSDTDQIREVVIQREMLSVQKANDFIDGILVALQRNQGSRETDVTGPEHRNIRWRLSDESDLTFDSDISPDDTKVRLRVVVGRALRIP